MKNLSLITIFMISLLVFGCTPDMSGPQKSFALGHKWAVDDYSMADNELQYKEIWEKRERNLCEKRLPDGAMNDWTGVVKNIGINRFDIQESANIDIRISDKKAYFLFTTSAINVKTLVGSVADSAAAIRVGEDPKTTIVRGSPLYDQLMSLKEGDKVRFSGQLIKDLVPGACFYELSITTNGKMRWPEYVARFTSIQKID